MFANVSYRNTTIHCKFMLPQVYSVILTYTMEFNFGLVLCLHIQC